MAYMTKSDFNLRPSIAAGMAAKEDVIITERGVPTYRLSKLPPQEDPWGLLVGSGVITPPKSNVPYSMVVTGGNASLGEMLDEDRADRW